MTKEEFTSWQAVTESSRYRWTEDVIFSLNGRGSFYFIGGEDGAFIQIHKDGKLIIGTYEGAIPHIGEAMFKAIDMRQLKDYSEAFSGALSIGGKKFLVDMFSGSDIPVPVVATEKPSIREQLGVARRETQSSSKTTPEKSKDNGGIER